MRILVVTALLASCSSAPTEYVRQPWAVGSVEQAEAQCRNEVQANITTSFPACMNAKGWAER